MPGQTRELHTATLANDVQKVKEILQKKVLKEKRYPVDVLDEVNETPLLKACGKTGISLDIIRALIQAGANVNFVNASGATPLAAAAGVRGNVALVKLLVEAGADIRYILPKTGNTMLMFACCAAPDPELIEYLLPSAKDLEAINNAGHTALAFACTKNSNMTVIKYLLEQGANPNNILPSVLTTLKPNVLHILKTHSRYPFNPVIANTAASPKLSHNPQGYFKPAPANNNNFQQNIRAATGFLNAVAEAEKQTNDLINNFNNFTM